MDCLVCDKIKERKAIIVMETDSLIAVMPSRPAVQGHVRVMPKSHFAKLDEMPQDLASQALAVASMVSSATFDVTKARGSNIILNENDEHLAIDVLPRKENDGLNFSWKPRQSSPEELDGVFGKLKDKSFTIGKKEKKVEVLDMDIDKGQKITGLGSIVEKGAAIEATGIVPTEASKEAQSVKEPKKEEKLSENYLLKNLTKIP